MNNIKNIELIVHSLKVHNIDQIVISPGGTNQVFAKAVQDDSFFTCYSVVDERSAIYFAIGLYLQLRKPIVASCTSAQATRNYIPGLTEGFYKKIPILAITMSKHPRFLFQEYMQAPNQASLPNDCVKHSYILPCIADENDILYSSRQIDESILELTHNGNGPVQLCVPWLDFPLKSTEPDIKTIRRIGINEIGKLDIEKKRILVCIGEHLPFCNEFVSELEKFCERNDVVVYTNHLSNYHGKYTIQGNLPLLVIDFKVFMENLKPDILITIGGQTGDYPFYNLFSRNDIQGVEHWRVSIDGDIVDTYDKLTLVIQADEQEFFEKLNALEVKEPPAHNFYKRWSEYFCSIKTDINVPFSAVSIAQTLSKKIPKNSILQFSILNSLRIWNMFHIDPSIECYSNVGAFGIDGGMSTLIGQSVVTDKMSFLIIGDLAFLYDLNSISIRHIKNNLKILVVNNAGGVEFKLWGGNLKSIDSYIAASGHFKNAEGWAKTCGFKYITAKTKKEFEERTDAFIMESSYPVLLEAFVSDTDESEAYSNMITGNKSLTIKDKAKFAIKRMIR